MRALARVAVAVSRALTLACFAPRDAPHAQNWIARKESGDLRAARAVAAAAAAAEKKKAEADAAKKAAADISRIHLPC